MARKRSTTGTDTPKTDETKVRHLSNSKRGPGRPRGSKNKPEFTGSAAALRQAETRFKAGQSGNPNGRPKGSRQKISSDYILGLQDIFDEIGVVAIRNVAQESPLEFLKLVSAIVPKQFGLEEGTQNAFIDVWRAISEGRA